MTLWRNNEHLTLRGLAVALGSDVRVTCLPQHRGTGVSYSPDVETSFSQKHSNNTDRAIVDSAIFAIADKAGKTPEAHP